MSSSRTSPVIEAAAKLPGEYNFLAAIVAAPWDEGFRLVYADWLEEQGDPRSDFVRKLVTATRSLRKGTKLPDSRALPQAWTNMLGVPLLEGIVELDLVALKDAVLRLARPIVTITTEPVKEDLLEVSGSKFGGHPDLPRDTPWPTCDQGPLGFLGQIAIRDVKNTQVARSLPEDGLLSFFAYQSFKTGYQPGVVEAVENDTCVLITGASASRERRQPPEDLDEGNAILPSCQLAFTETWDLPDIKDNLPAFLEADLEKLNQGKRADAVHDLRRKCHPFGHHLMGYSVHFRTSDPSPGPEWPHLLCLDSDNNLGWSWCDGEHLAVFVHEEDLANGTFLRVYGYAS
jgi:uncharacterized protein (TIGR02996 family)